MLEAGLPCQPSGVPPDVDVSCCFCGGVRRDDDPITVAAIWTQDGREREQYWGAHRSCFLAAMDDEFRQHFGGPLADDE